MQIAQVIVDVPTRQTNQNYSYLIPEELKDRIKLGIRVMVPFGNRKITGFVVGITNETKYDGKLKAISSLIDIIPQLNTELLNLSDWLAKDTYSFKINCLQTMLPGSLHVKTKKMIKANSIELVQKFPGIFNGKFEVEYDSKNYNNQITRQILDLEANGDIEIKYVLAKNADIILVSAVKSNLNLEELEEVKVTIRKNATAQFRLIEYLENHIDEIILNSDLINLGISNDAINTFVKKGILTKEKVQKKRNPFINEVVKSEPLKLNSDQNQAVTKITQAVGNKTDTVFLLEGVTGSGKTEVYLQSIDYALKSGQTALMLVPEITLTPQIVSRIRSRFGNQVALQHSALSDGERFDEWQRINSGEAKVVVGVRSAIFAPLENIGLIIMDEEHDGSYKQEENPRYQTREVAKWRGNYNNCPIVLGSATPSLESRARASKGLYERIVLPTRINNQAMPEVSIIDMKDEVKQFNGSGISQALQVAIQQRLDKHEQVILMLNRRGYSAFVVCRDCGYTPQCPNCDITLTMHKDTNTLNCHYCGFKSRLPKTCPQCNSDRIRYFGMGSQKLEEAVQGLYPDAKVLRMDVDTTRKKGHHEKIITKFENQEADILVGTQMIAKGLDFPNVTLVGVLNADSSLAFPDFRSSERTFELLTQVAGRAGRANKKGEVVIQTYNPDHYAIQLAKQQDYEQFFKKEMQVRRLGKYPPYFFTIKLTGNSKNENQTMQMMFSVFNFLKKELSNQAIILGPAPKMITRVNNRYYYQIIIKYRNEEKLKSVLNQLLNDSQSQAKYGLQFSIDNDPIDFM